MPNSAQRLNNLPPYIFVSIAEKIQQLQQAGHHILRLDIGNPDMPPPEHVIARLSASAQDPTKHGYSGYRGTPIFRQAVADHYARRFGATLDPETEVLPLIGSKEGVVNLTTAFLDPTDTVLVPEVGYPSYAMAAHLNHANIVWVPMDPANNYMLKLSDISTEDASRAKLLWINYPNNPTGGVITQQNYAEIVTFCNEHDILLASDNPYVDITYDGVHAGSALEAPGALDCTVELMSFSKSYNMAGWRLGAAVGNREVLKHLLKIKSNMDSGHFKAIYDAGICALTDTSSEWLVARNAVYQHRRDKILAALPAMGLTAPHSPGGAMYIWVTPSSGEDALTYVEDARQQAHVSLAPGAAYGPGGKDFIRISVGVPDNEIDQALEQLTAWFARRG